MDLPGDVGEVFASWQARGKFLQLKEGHRIFAVQEGSGPDVVLLHGFPSSSHDFALALPYLTSRYRVTTWDHLGFGFSDKPWHSSVSYSLLDQARRGGEVVSQLGIERAVVVGHDMGLTIAVEMLCQQEEGKLPFAMEALVLCNGSHLIELAHLTPLQEALMTDEGAKAFRESYDPERFAEGFRFLWADPSRTPQVHVRAIAYWLAYNGGLEGIGRIARYNLERRQYAQRWRSIFARTRVPVRIVWGDRDPIAVLEIGKRLAEMARAPLAVLEGVGHYPQMEAPEAWAEAVVGG